MASILVKKVTVSTPITGVIDLNTFNFADVGNGDLLVYDSASGEFKADSATYLKVADFNSSSTDSAAIRSMFSAGGDLSYDSASAQFSIDVEAVYTKTNFDSDLGASSTTITSLGAVNAGSITSDFGNIDIGSSTFTSSGTVNAGTVVATTLDISGNVDIDGTLETDGLSISSTAITATAAELNILDGVTSAHDELNILDGATITTNELNILDGVTATAAELNILDGVTSTATELNILDGVTSTTAELNLLDGVTATTVQINNAALTTSSTAELNILDGVTATTTELNLLDGGTSATSTTVADADRVILNDNGTMKQVAVTDLNVYFGGDVSAVGTLTSGSIAAGFGAIDNGTSGIRSNVITAETSFLPDAQDGASLGTTSLQFSDIFLADGAVIGLGDDNEVTLTHVPDTGILLNGTNVIQFNDASQNIGAPSATVLDINATDEVEINATLADINANLDVSGTYTGGGLMTTGGNIVIPDGGLIGSVSDVNAIQIEADGDIVISQDLAVAGNFTVTGTTTQVNTVTMNAQNAVVFEGATADDHETTLTVVDPTADRTINLPNVSGTLPVLAAVSTTAVTSTPEELNILDGVTSTTAELNLLDGVTATTSQINNATLTTSSTAELNILDGVTSTTAELNILDGVTASTSQVNNATLTTSTTAELNILDGVTSTTAELNILDGVTSTTAELNILDGVTSTAAELNILDGVTSTAAELNKLDGATITTAEVNILDGDTSASSVTLVDADRVVVNDAGVMKQVTMTTLNTYMSAGSTVAADDLIVGNNSVNLATTSGNITIDAREDNTDIIFKGTDGGADTTFLTLDGSEAGKATFNDQVVVGDGKLVLNATAVTSTAAELNILDGVTATTAELNIMDGGTSATSTTVADADRVVLNDNGTMVQVAVTDMATYFSGSTTAVGALNSGSITSGFGNINNGASTITTTGLISGGSLDIDDVLINGTTIGHTDDTDLITLADGLVTVAGEISVTTLDIGGTNVTSTAAELNILDGVTSTAAELNILDGVTASAADINLIDGITNGTVIASKAIITDANKDITGGRNITISGEIDAATLDISGNADIDGTLEADAITIGGVTLAETISDTVGAMVTSNTETGVAVTYDDADNTLDFVIGTLNQNTTGSAATLTTARNIGGVSFDGSANIDLPGVNSAGNQNTSGSAATLTTARTIGGTSFDGSANIAVGLAATATALATARTIHGVSFDGSANIDLSEVISDTVGAMVGSNTETGITVTYQDADNTIDFVVGTLNQDTTGNAATATALETARTIHGVSFDGSANIDLSEVISDTVGAMVGSNTETGITVTYQDGDNTIDFALAAAQTTITSLLAADIKIGEDDQTKIDFETADEIHFYAANAHQIKLVDGALVPVTDDDIDLGTSSLEFKNAFFDGTVTSDAFAGPLTGDVTGNVSGTAATVTGAAQSAITSLGTLTALTVDSVIVNGATIGHTDDTDLMTVADGVLTVAGEVSMTTLDIGGTNVTSTAAELNILDGVTSTAAELNILDGVTSTAAELNILDGVTSTAAELNILDGVTSTAAELNVLDGVTAVVGELNALDLGSTAVGTAIASKAVILDANKDYTGVRNLTISGELDAGSLDISGNVDVDGTLETDALSINGTAITATAAELNLLDSATVTTAELNILDGVTATAAELNILDGVTATATELNLIDGVTATTAELNILDGVTATAAELNILDGVTATAAEINLIDGGTARGTTAVADGDGFLTNDGGTMRMTKVDTLATYMSSKISGGGAIVATGALNSGSITSGFGNIDNGSSTITTTGAVSTGTLAASTGTFSGVLKTDDATEATSTTDGSLQTDGGLSVAKDVVAGNDVKLLSDASVVALGADGDVTLTHVHNTGILLNSTNVIQFNDASQNIGAPSGTVLDINATDEIELNATLVDINGNVEISGNLTIAGTTTQVDTVTMNAQNAVVFEGATADDHETTLTIIDPTADRTINLPNVSGTIPVLAAASNTAITSTPAELNILDGVTSTAAELNILDGVTSTAAELNILDGVTSTAAELNILDGVTSTAAELNILDGVTSTATELNLLDGSSANSVVNSKAVVYGSSGELAGTLSTAAQGNVTSLGTLTALTVDNMAMNGNTLTTTSADYVIDASHDIVLDADGGDIVFKDGGTGIAKFSNSSTDLQISVETADKDIKFTGTDGSSGITALTLDMSAAGAATFNDKITAVGTSVFTNLDISGDVDVDGTLEADAITLGGTALATSATTDTTNASNIASGTLAAARMAAAQTAITSILATDVKIGEDDQTKIDFETADEIHFYAANAHQIKLVDGALVPVTDNDIDLGTSSLEFKNAFFDGTVTSDAFAGPLTGNVTGNVSGSAATVTTAAQSAITSLGTLTALTVDNVVINGATIGHGDDTDLMTVADGIVTVAGEISVTTLDIGGTNVTSTAAELNILDGVTSTAAELNILDGVTSTAAELNILDGVTSTAAELNILDGVTSTAAELNALDGITAVVGELNALDIGSTAVGTAVASKAVILDANKDYTGIRNFTVSGELDAATGDFSGDVDIDGTLEADAITVNGTALAEVISDTVGAMVSSNTESGISVVYQDADNTLDFTVATLNQNTTGSAATLTTARTIGGVSFNGSANINLPGVNTGGNQNTTGSAATLTTARTINGTSFDGSANITLGTGSVTHAMLAADCIDGDNIGNDVINSEHYAAGSIDNEHIADDAINSEHYAAGSIDTAHIADDQITQAKMANDAVGSAELKTLATLLILDSAGSTLRTFHCAGA